MELLKTSLDARWELELLYCDEADLSGSSGLVIMRFNHGVRSNGLLVAYDSDYGAPVHVNSMDTFIVSEEGPRVVYSVPDQCVFRLASSPLQRVYRDGDGEVVAQLHQRVERRNTGEAPLRSFEVQVRLASKPLLASLMSVHVCVCKYICIPCGAYRLCVFVLYVRMCLCIVVDVCQLCLCTRGCVRVCTYVRISAPLCSVNWTSWTHITAA
jgi:hypothetical protein